MTREEAIKIIDCYDIGFYDLSGEKISADKLANAFDMAIEALSAELTATNTEKSSNCGDLISRADAMGTVQDHFNADGFKGYDDGQKMMDRIKALPIADRPHGEWIVGVDEETGDNDAYAWTCSVCGEKYPWQPNFCPNCGADMRKGEK